jgi:beta-glucanase (GH16 family)
METVNGQLTGYGTVHCNVYPGGVCNEPTGIGGSIGIPDQEWHNWRIEWDRRPGDWQSEVITWYRDGVQFHSVTGSRIGNQAVWNSLSASPLYFILNMAVGGDWVSAIFLNVPFFIFRTPGQCPLIPLRVERSWC